MSAIITLLTDFGDLYPAVMKGTILRINPDAKIVDISHNIPPQNLRSGAFALMYVAGRFPEGTIHVAVIDPGVGTGRRPIVIKGKQIFVGPDNGLLIPAARSMGHFIVYEIPPELCIPPVSSTFHGRDVFAPSAAHLSRGYDISEFRQIDDFIELDFGEVYVSKESLQGEVIYIDDFGNVITNIPGSLALEYINYGDHVELLGRKIPFAMTYDEANSELITIGSHNFLEISVKRGNAAKLFRLNIGDVVHMTSKQ
ncbi:MAG: SAM-dependent chlorinase/fluorinase [Methanocellales archaeon]|nr:SAM-dependent chlorinase/fluorinase [Methanocellales archaeon]MDD3421425.1 SAM-dependent chlorinase/fluorinase [Methanocellales archaeon]MDD5446866.1 SAM-dependent chlorinase/fluorinase [Methanocellales archaeon]